MVEILNTVSFKSWFIARMLPAPMLILSLRFIYVMIMVHFVKRELETLLFVLCYTFIALA
jgi:hypothetical protein